LVEEKAFSVTAAFFALFWLITISFPRVFSAGRQSPTGATRAFD